LFGDDDAFFYLTRNGRLVMKTIGLPFALNSRMGMFLGTLKNVYMKWN